MVDLIVKLAICTKQKTIIYHFSTIICLKFKFPLLILHIISGKHGKQGADRLLRLLGFLAYLLLLKFQEKNAIQSLEASLQFGFFLVRTFGTKFYDEGQSFVIGRIVIGKLGRGQQLQMQVGNL